MLKQLFQPHRQLKSFSQSKFGSKKEQESSASSDSNLTPMALARCSMQQARKLITFERANDLKVLPLGLMVTNGREVLSVAGSEERRQEIEQAVRFLSEKEVRFLPVAGELIEQAIFYAYHRDGLALTRHLKSLQQVSEQTGALIPPESLFKSSRGEPAQFLSSLIEYSISYSASDLHILPRVDGSFVKLRVNGELLFHPQAICSLLVHQQLVRRIKVLASLDTSIHTMPQDGSFVVPLAQSQVYARVSIMPTIHGEKVVIRFLGTEGVRELNSLGFDNETLSQLKSIAAIEDGVVLFAGPTGSGKSTSMYALLLQLLQAQMNIVSFEDPVEIQISGISQTSINPKLGLDYPQCLRAVLRQDPDVILIGEMRDSESANIAFQAALTGHLLISTVHARNVAEVFLRLKSLQIDVLSLAQTLRLIVVQRLVSVLCQHCKVVDLQASQFKGFEIFKATGCSQCDYSGFSNRVPISECLPVSRELSRLLVGRQSNISESELQADPSYISPRAALDNLLKQGQITIADYQRLREPW